MRRRRGPAVRRAARPLLARLPRGPPAACPYAGPTCRTRLPRLAELGNKYAETLHGLSPSDIGPSDIDAEVDDALTYANVHWDEIKLLPVADQLHRLRARPGRPASGDGSVEDTRPRRSAATRIRAKLARDRAQAIRLPVELQGLMDVDEIALRCISSGGPPTRKPSCGWLPMRVPRRLTSRANRDSLTFSTGFSKTA